MTDYNPRRNGSVTAPDLTKGKNGAPFTFFLFPNLFAPTVTGAKPGLPAWWSRGRDAVLRTTPHLEDMWAGSIAKVVTKQSALGFTVTDSEQSDRRVESSQRLLLFYDGAWHHGLSRNAQDFLTQENGAFIEVERATRAPFSKTRALWHLDSAYCRRTGNPEWPVVYTDALGAMHPLRYDQVIALSDQPSPMRQAFGISTTCAASRAWTTILKLAAIEIYFREKITGGRALAVHFVNGIGQDQLEDAFTDADEAQSRKGYTVYKGSIIIPLRAMNVSPEVVTIDLASIPDGFDVEQERKAARLIYAQCLGVPLQDIEPLSGQGLGTGAQTVIQSEDADTYGMAAYRKALAHYLNVWVLPKTTEFGWTNLNDARERKQKADADTARIAGLAQAVQVGALSPVQMLNILADEKIVPKEMVAQDLTPGGALADSEKPTGEQSLLGQFAVAKAARATIESEWDAAMAWAEEAEA